MLRRRVGVFGRVNDTGDRVEDVGEPAEGEGDRGAHLDESVWPNDKGAGDS